MTQAKFRLGRSHSDLDADLIGTFTEGRAVRVLRLGDLVSRDQGGREHECALRLAIRILEEDFMVHDH